MDLSNPAAVATQFEAAWNAHDMQAFTDLFRPDATFVGRYATYWRGRDKIVAGHKTIHETSYSDSILTVDPPDVDVLTPDIAVLHCWTRLATGAAHPAGPHQVDTLMLAVVMRHQGQWKIVAAENVALVDPQSGAQILRKQ